MASVLLESIQALSDPILSSESPYFLEAVSAPSSFGGKIPATII